MAGVELRHLRNFVAIAEEGSITRAAERLWLAQPGLSAQVRRLEQELGVQLLERHTRGVELTDAGELFLERARVTLAAADDALSTGRDLAAGVVGNLVIGLSVATRCSLADELLEQFAGARPGVEVTVVQSVCGVLMRDVRDGRLDAAVVPAPFTQGARRREFASEPLVLAVGRSHRLAGLGPVVAGELEGEELLVCGHRDGAAYDAVVAGLLDGAGVAYSEQRGGWGSDFLGAVAKGRALAVTTPGSISRGDVHCRELRPAQRLAFDLVWREGTPSPALSAFLSLASRVGEARPAAGQLRALVAA